MQPPQSIEEIKAGLETTEKGGVRQSIRNCLTVFQRDPLLSGAIAYNILTDRKDIIKPIGFHRESTALNDTDSEFSERVCIDTQQKRSAGMRSLHPSDAERKGFGHSPTSILNLIFRNRIQKSCRGTTAHCLRVL